VYGILVAVTHDELAGLYERAQELADHYGRKQNAAEGVYRPEPVLVRTGRHSWRPALCYMAEVAPGQHPAADYLDGVLRAAMDHGFPASYVDRIRQFASTT
jgi:hypothetical protein